MLKTLWKKVFSNPPVIGAKVRHEFLVECFDAQKILKWAERFKNTVVTAGLNKYLDATLVTGYASPAWYVGLKDTGSVAAGDTMASHAGWAELDIYSEATRPAWTPGAVSGGAVDNASTKAAFSITTADVVYGAFLVNDSTKSGTDGTLLGAGDFASTRSVASGDTLNVTVTCSQTAG